MEPPVPGSPGAPATSFNTTSETEIAGYCYANCGPSSGCGGIAGIWFRFTMLRLGLVAMRAAAGYFAGSAGLKRRPAADRRGERAFVEIIELAADRHAVGEPRHLDVGVVQQVGDVVGGALAVHGGVERQNNFLHRRIVGAPDQRLDGEVLRPDAVERG